MQIVIDIPDKVYGVLKYFEESMGLDDKKNDDVKTALIRAVVNGIPLPKGHGDLIERNAALDDIGLGEFHRYDDYAKMRNYLKSIPTIIESSKEV